MPKLAVTSAWSTPFAWTKYMENVGKMLCRFDRPGWTADYFLGKGIDPAGRHVSCCLQALEWGADAILHIGPDQVHPLDMLNRLVARFEQTGGDVITALVPSRGYIEWHDMEPFQPLAWRLRVDGVRELRGFEHDRDMYELIDPADGDFQRVDVIGSGVMLFHRDALLALTPPWFWYACDPRTMQRVADMDTRFIWRLRTEAGCRVWVDTTIEVKHLHTFEIDGSFQHRFRDWKAGGGSADEYAYGTARGAAHEQV